MYRRGFFFRLIGFLLIAALLFGIGASLYRAGYTQGITMGALMSAEDSGLAAPWPGGAMNPYLYPYGYGFGFHRGPSLGLFFLGGLALLLLVGFFFRPRRYWHAGGEHRHPHGWKWEGPYDGPPWRQREGAQPEKEQTPAEDGPPAEAQA